MLAMGLICQPDFYSGKYILIDVVAAAKVPVVSPTSGSIGGGTQHGYIAMWFC